MTVGTVVNVGVDTCQVSHKLSSCPLFLKMSAFDRQQIIDFNCLHPGHKIGACTSQFTCKERKLKHHSVLHREKPSTPSTQIYVSKRNAQSNLSTAFKSDVKPNCNEAKGNQPAKGFCANATNTSNVHLPTALFKIRDKSREDIQIRALLDSGSQASFITESNAKALMLKLIRTQTPISPNSCRKGPKNSRRSTHLSD